MRRQHPSQRTRPWMGLLVGALASCAGTLEPIDPPPTFSNGPTPHIRGAGSVTDAPGTVADLAFLTGRWSGTAFGGEVDEVWSPPSGGAMVGHFRLSIDGQPSFYELMTLVTHEDRVKLRLKHFGPDLTPWEQAAETVDFPLILVRDTTAWFEGLTFHRDGDQLLIYLAMSSEGQVREEELRLRRID